MDKVCPIMAVTIFRISGNAVPTGTKGKNLTISLFVVPGVHGMMKMQNSVRR